MPVSRMTVTVGLGRASALGLLLALVLVVCGVSAAESAPEEFTPEQWPAANPTILKFRRLTCANVDATLYFYVLQRNPAFTGVAPPTLQAFDFAPDPSATAAYRIMGAFTSPDGQQTFTAAEGFDPCLYTTCAGIQCKDPTRVLAQRYEADTAFAFGGEPMTYLPYGRTLVLPRCDCIDPTTGRGPMNSTHQYIVDPAGPAAEQSAAVCDNLVCGTTPTQRLRYYLEAPDNTAASCECCEKQLDMIAKDSAFPPACGAVRADTTTTTLAPGSDGGDSSGSAGPNPVEPPSTFYEFIRDACPVGTTDTLTEEVAMANQTSFCCYFTVAEGTAEYHCGSTQLLALRGPGVLNCVSQIPEHAFTCCANVAENGGVATTGRRCNGTIVDPGNGAAAGPVSLVALVGAAALLLIVGL